MTDWLSQQRLDLKSAFASIRDKKELVIAQPYFNLDRQIDGSDVFWADDKHFRTHEEFKCDIYFTQGYPDDRNRIRYVRSLGRAKIIANWFWDNHHLIADTLNAAMLADINFHAHNYKSDYIKNSLSIHGGFVPLCPIFWKFSELEEAASMALLADRSTQLYGGYNSYLEFPDRDILIGRIKEYIPNNNLFITPHGTPVEKHPFYSMTPVDRILEWMKYKVTLCISFGENTAIRIFDMLLAGGIPLVVGRPTDLDLIIPRSMQDILPIIVIDEADPESIAAAFAQCLERFDAMGNNGVMMRHEYIKRNHMPHHRLGKMIETIRSIAERVEDIDHLVGT